MSGRSQSAQAAAAELPPLQGRRHEAAAPGSSEIFDADHSHKCPTYIQSTPPCQGSCPSGEDIRGYLNIVRGIEKPPAGMPWQEYAFRRLTEANPLPVGDGPRLPGALRVGLQPQRGRRLRRHQLGRALPRRVRASRTSWPSRSRRRQTGKKVAVIGGGPAGLSAAYQLALQGPRGDDLRRARRTRRHDALRHPGLPHAARRCSTPRSSASSTSA